MTIEETANNEENGVHNDFLPTPLSKVKDDPYYLPTSQDGHKIYSCK